MATSPICGWWRSGAVGDLVGRLRTGDDPDDRYGRLLHEAADDIEALEAIVVRQTAEISRLKTALAAYRD